MVPLFAQGNLLSDLAAFIGAVTGLLAGVFAIWKYLDERRKRLAAEVGKEDAEEREKKAEVGKQQLADALNQLQTSMDKLEEPLANYEGEMDQKLVAHVQQLAEAVNQLRHEIAELKNRLAILEQGRVTPKEGSAGATFKPVLPDDLEQRLRRDANIQRLLNNANWKGAAEAAIAFFFRGEECPIPGWRSSSTWKQVQAVFERLQNEV